MGFDLKNRRGLDFRFSVWEWRAALELARDFGWKPEGTLPPIDYDPASYGAFNVTDVMSGQRIDFDVADDVSNDKWSGTYSTNDGQIMSDTDAAAMADALEKALVAITEFRTLGVTYPEIYLGIMQGTHSEARAPAPVENDDNGVPDMMPLLWQVGLFHQGDVNGIPRRHRARVLMENCEASWEKYLGRFVQYCRLGGFQIW